MLKVIALLLRWRADKIAASVALVITCFSTVWGKPSSLLNNIQDIRRRKAAYYVYRHHFSLLL